MIGGRFFSGVAPYFRFESGKINLLDSLALEVRLLDLCRTRVYSNKTRKILIIGVQYCTAALHQRRAE